MSQFPTSHDIPPVALLLASPDEVTEDVALDDALAVFDAVLDAALAVLDEPPAPPADEPTVAVASLVEAAVEPPPASDPSAGTVQSRPQPTPRARPSAMSAIRFVTTQSVARNALKLSLVRAPAVARLRSGLWCLSHG